MLTCVLPVQANKPVQQTPEPATEPQATPQPAPLPAAKQEPVLSKGEKRRLAREQQQARSEQRARAERRSKLFRQVSALVAAHACWSTAVSCSCWQRRVSYVAAQLADGSCVCRGAVLYTSSAAAVLFLTWLIIRLLA